MEENRKKTTCNRIFGARKNTPSETGRSLVGRCNKGFTLVELIVVLIVLAIVAAIVVPALLGFNDKGKEATCKMEAQKALAATQAALSDIYNDTGNRFDHDKRDRVKELAGAGDKTAFTVWTEKTLMDGYTTAVAENIGSYTIKKAVYKANDGLYFYYDGKNWTSFDNENDATAGVTGNEKNNVIFVWPYDGKTDFALNDNGNQQGQQGGDPNGENNGIVRKYVNLYLSNAADYSGHIYFRNMVGDQPDHVTVEFWKNGDGSTGSFWIQNQNEGENYADVDKSILFRD